MSKFLEIPPLSHHPVAVPANRRNSPSTITIQNHIRALRLEHAEMTQQALADRIGVSRQTVNAIERGKYSPSLEVAFQIARVFNRPLEEVFRCRTGGR